MEHERQIAAGMPGIDAAKRRQLIGEHSLPYVAIGVRFGNGKIIATTRIDRQNIGQVTAGVGLLELCRNIFRHITILRGEVVHRVTGIHLLNAVQVGIDEHHQLQLTPHLGEDSAQHQRIALRKFSKLAIDYRSLIEFSIVDGAVRHARRTACRRELVIAHFLEHGDRIFFILQSKILDQFHTILLGFLRVATRCLRTRECPYALEQTLRGGNAHQGHHLAAAARLTKDRHIFRVAAEVGNILVDPFERLDVVHHAQIPRVFVFFAIGGKIKVTQAIQAGVDRYEYDIAILSKVVAIVGCAFDAGTGGITAAMEPNDDRLLGLCIQRHSPYIQILAIFILKLVGAGIFREICNIAAVLIRRILGRNRARGGAVKRSFPRGVLRLFKAVCLRIRNAHERVNAIVPVAANAPAGSIGKFKRGIAGISRFRERADCHSQAQCNGDHER